MVDQSHCFTLKHVGKSNIIVTPIAFRIPTLPDVENNNFYQTQCIWDTGAGASVITQRVIDALGLQPTGITFVNTASENNRQTNQYELDIFLSNDLVFRNVTVTEGTIIDGIDCLLGMDIIGVGDFSLTYYQGNTCMSFRYPSQHEVDFYNNPKIEANRTQRLAEERSRMLKGAGKRRK